MFASILYVGILLQLLENKKNEFFHLTTLHTNRVFIISGCYMSNMFLSALIIFGHSLFMSVLKQAAYEH
jgi:hypothetical protein